MNTDNDKSKDQDAGVTSPRVLKSRAELRDLLIDAGLARGAAEKLSRGGWPALGSDEINEADAMKLAAEMRALASLFKAHEND
jgi:hypothetical protein